MNNYEKKRKVTGFTRRRNDRYESVVYYYDMTGKRRYKSKSTGIKVEYFSNGKPKKVNEYKLEKKLEEFIEEIKESLKIENSYSEEKILFSEFFKDFALRKKRRLSPSSFPQYYSAVCNRIIPFFEGKYLSKITTEMIDDYYSFLKFQRKNSDNTIKHYHIYLKEALNYAYRKKLIKENPASFIKINKVYPKEKEIYELNDIIELLQIIKNTEIELPIILAMLYGLRRAEVLGLKWEAIDFEKNIIYIKRTVSLGGDEQKRKVIKQEKTKTYKSTRLIPFTQRIRRLLLKEKEKQKLWKDRLGNTYNTDWEGYVFLQNSGKIIHPDSLSRNYKKFVNNYISENNKNHKLKYIPYKNLRTSCATVFKYLDIDGSDISNFLGHEIEKTTNDFYIQNKFKFLIRMVEKLEKELEIKEKENITDSIGW